MHDLNITFLTALIDPKFQQKQMSNHQFSQLSSQKLSTLIGANISMSALFDPDRASILLSYQTIKPIPEPIIACAKHVMTCD